MYKQTMPALTPDQKAVAENNLRMLEEARQGTCSDGNHDQVSEINSLYFEGVKKYFCARCGIYVKKPKSREMIARMGSVNALQSNNK